MYNSPGISIALIFITVGIGFKHKAMSPKGDWKKNTIEEVMRLAHVRSDCLNKTPVRLSPPPSGSAKD
ncbi:conserved hypothetical protein [Ricinus communis]|uniref:Uncharacterized protein n=1 Tax=Ricinus communis TaxID=3988 RepID=B9RL47_RICCO|nr:conserved hypothetical protein [Ricinus communis]